MRTVAYSDMGIFPLYLGFTTSRKAFAREMKRLEVDDCSFLPNDHSAAATHYLTNRDMLVVIIAMPKAKGKSQEQVAGLIAHEATHVAQQLWEHIGEKQPGAEAEAYLVQHITQFALQQYYDTGRSRAVEP